MTTITQTISALSTAPARSQPAATFISNADAFVGGLGVIGPQMNTMASQMNTVAGEVNANAVVAAAANVSAVAASAAVAATAGVTLWVSGTTYAIGNNTYSPINSLTYRRRTAGAGIIDPSADATNWASVIPTTGSIKIAPVAGGALTSPSLIYALMANAAYILPDITGASSFGLISPSNAAAVPASVTTSDGWSVATGFSAGTLKMIMPTSSATPHGIWGAQFLTPPVISSLNAAGTPIILGTALIAAGLLIILYGVTANTSIYAVAMNTATGAFGAPALLSATWIGTTYPSAIYADSTSTFVVGFTSSNGLAIVGSVSGLAITLGNNATFPYGVTGLIQLQSGSYIIYSNNGQFEVISVASTTLVIGANTAATTGGGTRIERVSNTTAIAVGKGGGNPGQLTAAVIMVSGTTGTPGTAVIAATAILKYTPDVLVLKSFAAGGPFLVCAQDNSVSTTGDYYGISVSGAVATIGVVTQLTNNLPTELYDSTYQLRPSTDAWSTIAPYNNTTMLLGHLAGGAFAITIAGTTLTAGASYGTAATSTFVNDVATGSNFYAITSTTVNKITVSGTVISSVYQLAGSPVIVASDTLNDKAVSYSGSWYSWNLPTMSLAVTSNQWLGISGSTLNLYGPIS